MVWLKRVIRAFLKPRQVNLLSFAEFSNLKIEIIKIRHYQPDRVNDLLILFGPLVFQLQKEGRNVCSVTTQALVVLNYIQIVNFSSFSGVFEVINLPQLNNIINKNQKNLLPESQLDHPVFAWN